MKKNYSSQNGFHSIWRSSLSYILHGKQDISWKRCLRWLTCVLSVAQESVKLGRSVLNDLNILLADIEHAILNVYTKENDLKIWNLCSNTLVILLSYLRPYLVKNQVEQPGTTFSSYFARYWFILRDHALLVGRKGGEVRQLNRDRR